MRKLVIYHSPKIRIQKDLKATMNSRVFFFNKSNLTKNKFQNNAFYIFIKSTKFFLSFYKNSRYPSNLLFFIQNRCLHFTDNILHYHLLCHFQIPLCILPCEWLNVLHPFALIFLKFPLNILSSFHFCIPNPIFSPWLSISP